MEKIVEHKAKRHNISNQNRKKIKNNKYYKIYTTPKMETAGQVARLTDNRWIKQRVE